jgi:hypothetical protein
MRHKKKGPETSGPKIIIKFLLSILYLNFKILNKKRAPIARSPFNMY